MQQQRFTRRSLSPRIAAVARVLGAVLLVTASVAACGPAAPSAESVTWAADDFLSALRDGRWETAYGALGETVQGACGSPDRLAAEVARLDARPATWSLREPQVRPSMALLTGTVELAGGGSGIVELAFDRVGEAWRVNAWSASNREPCFAPRGGAGD